MNGMEGDGVSALDWDFGALGVGDVFNRIGREFGE